ncbi:carbon-nitrogen hydrolase family protein [Skermanella pratensis]|uniref:carbon-nitrogen hydrolase family protein n=1 Tax=Skermanella pratensis TaxID=2233999 RepID=UPI001B3BEC3E|nr:carbon-nitrogen hydrolase family protein [Skermanella pratensis]
MTNAPLRLALLQMEALAGDIAANLDRIAAAAEMAAAAGAACLLAPELALTGYGAGAAIRDLAEPADGAQVAGLSAIAARTGVAVVCGFAEAAGGAVYNSAAAVLADGSRHVYRKLHLYGDYEKRLFRPGEAAPAVFPLGGLKAGLLICYDVEFPEMVRHLAASDADLILVPTALPASEHAGFIARSIIPVRAFENQVFVAYANHAGRDAAFAYAGLSGIAAPDGSDLARAPASGPHLLVADIDPAAFGDARAANPYLIDRRMRFISGPNQT